MTVFPRDLEWNLATAALERFFCKELTTTVIYGTATSHRGVFLFVCIIALKALASGRYNGGDEVNEPSTMRILRTKHIFSGISRFPPMIDYSRYVYYVYPPRLVVPVMDRDAELLPTL